MRWLAGFTPTKAIYTCRWSERCSAHCGRATLRRPDRWKTEEREYMALTGVLRPGHVALRVLDLNAAVKHYTEVLGLFETARDSQGRVFLKAWDEADHHSVVLREADAAGMDYMGWRVDSPVTLKRLAADVEESGLATDCTWIPAGDHPKTGE